MVKNDDRVKDWVDTNDISVTKNYTTTGTVQAAVIKDTGLTATRVVVATTGGQLADDSDLTFSGATLSATNMTSSNLVTGGTGHFGGVANYSEFEADGTLKMNGDATVWNDANVGALVLQTGGTLPGIVQWLDNDGDATGIYTRGFAVGEQGSGSIEIPHDYKEGTNLVFHVHWGANDAPTDTDKVQWELTYNVSREETTFPDSTVIVIETDYDTQYETKRSNFPAITGTAFKIGDQFNFTLKRIAASSVEFGGEALVETLGFHYEADTIGSRTIAAK